MSHSLACMLWPLLLAFQEFDPHGSHHTGAGPMKRGRLKRSPVLIISRMLITMDFCSVFAGFLGLALIIGISIHISNQMKTSQKIQLCLKDIRLQKIVEVLNHLKVIKFQVWETTFESLVEVSIYTYSFR